MKSTEQIFTDLAHLSRAASGWCTHNPNVSAAIYAADGHFVASGAHRKKISDDHAEIIALRAAGEKARDGTLYLSLEPCSHTGKTGPCTEAIKKSGIKKVVYAVNDLNLLASGGANALRSAGLEVIHQENASLEFEQRAWFHRMKHGRPLITAKVAITLDGRIAAADGTSKWITSQASRDDVQILRSQVQAIITSTSTYLSDQPSLLPRIDQAPIPHRVLMGARSIDAPGFKKINSRDFAELLGFLNSEGINHALVEAGGIFLSALTRAGLLDELVIYQAPIILGSGKVWIEQLGIKTLLGAIALEMLNCEQIGTDLKTHYRVLRK